MDISIIVRYGFSLVQLMSPLCVSLSWKEPWIFGTLNQTLFNQVLHTSLMTWIKRTLPSVLNILKKNSLCSNKPQESNFLQENQTWTSPYKEKGKKVQNLKVERESEIYPPTSSSEKCHSHLIKVQNCSNLWGYRLNTHGFSFNSLSKYWGRTP